MIRQHQAMNASVQEAGGDRTSRDPVCGMNVSVDSPHRHQHEGNEYRFCSRGCLEKVTAEPARYLQERKGAPNPAPPAVATKVTPGTGVTFTCPMHPQIVRDAPGSCPICGMALEPSTVTLDETENHELADMTRRFWVGVALCVPLLVVAMGDMLPGRPIERMLGASVAAWLQLVLASPVVLWAGWPFFVRG